MPQTVTVTGVDDCAADGDQSYSVVLGRPGSLDAHYSALDPISLPAVNRDNDSSNVCPQRFDGSAFVANGSAEGFAATVGLSPYYTGQSGLGVVMNVSQAGLVYAATPFAPAKTYTWRLTYDGAGRGTFAIYDGAALVATRTYTGSGGPLRTGNAVQVTAASATQVGKPNKVRVALTKLNGYAVDAVLETVNTVSTYQTSAYYKTPLLTAGMVLEGTVTFTHATTKWPAPLTLGLYVRMGNVSQ